MTHEVHDRRELVAANSLGILKMTDIILSRTQLPYLDELCVEKGLVCEPLIFQSRDDKEAKRFSILGEGANERERAMYWILGNVFSHTLAAVPFILDNACLLWCRESWLLAQISGFPRPD
jgi:hypothetical protein